jgi:hypothetical protein
MKRQKCVPLRKECGSPRKLWSEEFHSFPRAHRLGLLAAESANWTRDQKISFRRRGFRRRRKMIRKERPRSSRPRKTRLRLCTHHSLWTWNESPGKQPDCIPKFNGCIAGSKAALLRAPGKGVAYFLNSRRVRWSLLAVLRSVSGIFLFVVRRFRSMGLRIGSMCRLTSSGVLGLLIRLRTTV